MKKSAIIIITLLALCLSSCNPELPPASSVPDATSSDSTVSSEPDVPSSDATSSDVVSDPEDDFPEELRLLKSLIYVNNGVEKRFDFTRETLGDLEITDIKRETVSLSDRVSTTVEWLNDAKLLKTKMTGDGYRLNMYKITFTVINSGKTDLPLGEVTAYVLQDHSGGGRLDIDGFIDYIDSFVTEENAKLIDYRSWPFAAVGNCLNLLYQKYGVVEFDSFENVDISTAVIPLPETECENYYTDEQAAEAIKNANKYIEAVFGVADYISGRNYDEGCFYSKDGKPLKYVYMGETDYEHGPAYKVFENGLAMTGFEKDGDTVRVTYTSFYDTLGFFENYRYCLTFKETDVKDLCGVPYLRIVSGHFVND